jgi:hypothetical protein
VAEIEWKGILWKAAYGQLSVKDLLTVLKGYGPMEILEFEKPEACRGQMSLCLSADGTREITIHDLEVQGEKRQGLGRAAIQGLRNIFKGEIWVEYPELSAEQEVLEGSLFFWVKMYREGLIDGLECGMFCLYPEMSETELSNLEEEIKNLSGIDKAASGRDEGQR